MSSRPIGKQLLVDEVLRGLRRLARVLQLHSSLAEAEWGLTGPQLWALSELGQQGPLALKDLASRLYLHPSTLVGVVDRLEAKGLVQRKADLSDRRRIQLVLTSTGTRLFRRMERQGPGRMHGGLRSLQRTEVAGLGRTLHDLAESLEASLERAT